MPGIEFCSAEDYQKSGQDRHPRDVVSFNSIKMRRIRIQYNGDERDPLHTLSLRPMQVEKLN